VDKRGPAFATLTVFAVAVSISAGAWWAHRYLSTGQAGRDVNRAAWIASYEERGLEVPDGPRDGFWQDKIPKRVPNADLGWQETAVDLPGQITIDENGWQYYRSRGTARHKLLILGGSVAFGAYASSEEQAYFTRLGRILDADPRTASDIVVFASIAWKSTQELSAFVTRTQEVDPDWLILINGLNDLTNGANAKALYSQRTETLDGSRWTLDYHELDYLARASEYATNIAKMLTVAEQRDIEMMVVLQPALSERRAMTLIEADLFRRVEERYGSRGHLREAHQAVRRGLEIIRSQSDVQILDASRLFDDEPQTTFTDMWHFADPGHALLADAIAARLIPLLLAEDAARE